MFSIIPLKHRHHFSTFIMLYACIPAVYKNNFWTDASYTSLKTVTFESGSNLVQLGDNCFMNCKGLTQNATGILRMKKFVNNSYEESPV